MGQYMAITSFEQLTVWQEAHALVLEVYRVTANLPSEEKFGLVSQMRRAAVSVPANIAEGFKRRSVRDKAHLYTITQSSLSELHYYFILCRDLGYALDAPTLIAQTDQIGKMLPALTCSLNP